LAAGHLYQQHAAIQQDAKQQHPEQINQIQHPDAELSLITAQEQLYTNVLAAHQRADHADIDQPDQPVARNFISPRKRVLEDITADYPQEGSQHNRQETNNDDHLADQRMQALTHLGSGHLLSSLRTLTT
jgi:hypothetical protein